MRKFLVRVGLYLITRFGHNNEYLQRVKQVKHSVNMIGPYGWLQPAKIDLSEENLQIINLHNRLRYKEYYKELDDKIAAYKKYKLPPYHEN